jgi:hypothetical protein
LIKSLSRKGRFIKTSLKGPGLFFQDQPGKTGHGIPAGSFLKEGIAGTVCPALSGVKQASPPQSTARPMNQARGGFRLFFVLERKGNLRHALSTSSVTGCFA